MIDPVTSAANATASAQKEPGLTGAAQKMGKNEFLKLLVAQLQNQDPLKPQDNAQFVAELAQFSNLEQTIGINDRLDALSLQSQGLQNSNVVDMVGAKATVRGSMVTSNGSGTPTALRFALDGNADSVRITLTNQEGRAVRTIDVGKRSAGIATLNWDGKNDQGLIEPAGTYTVGVTAKRNDGAAVGVTQETSGVIKAVSFDKGYPVLQLDTGANVPVADLVRVER